MDCTHNYYVRSKLISFARAWLVLPPILLGLTSSGCAGAGQAARGAQRVSYAELSGPQRQAAYEKLTRVPVVIQFRRGERIPVELKLDSSLIELQAPDLTLIAKRDFALLLRADGGPLLSTDGSNFTPSEKNYFILGFNVTRDEPTSMRVVFGVRPDQTKARE
jgi:hypothetical protein